MSEKDYGFLFWPGTHWTTWGIYDTVQYALTGTYAIAFDVSVANLNHFGLINNPLPVEEAILAENSVVTDLPTAQVSYSAIVDGVESATTGFLSSTGQAKNPSRIIDMGRFMQRVDIPQVTYADGALSGSIQGSNSIDILGMSQSMFAFLRHVKTCSSLVLKSYLKLSHKLSLNLFLNPTLNPKCLLD